MSLLTNWLESLSIDITITERCSRRASNKSSCVTCIEHCHTQALSLEQNKMFLDLKKCDSCGDCTVVCPVSAIEGTIPKRDIINGMFAYSKEYCPTAKELLIYRKKGVKAIAIPEDCQEERWEKVIARANDILIQIEIEPLTIESTTARNISRRELFLSVKKNGQSLAKELTPASWRLGKDTWSLPINFPDHQFFQVGLAVDTCTLCQGCINICPQNVFTITDTELVIDHQKCTKCDLCSDICPEKAIQVTEHIADRTVTQIPLVKGKCNRCKSSFYSFQTTDYCHVCANKPSDWLMP